MNERELELAKQLRTYADNFAAFSFVQGAAFCYLLVQSLPVACTLRSHWCTAELLLLIAGLGYYWLISRCHRGEDRLARAPSTPSTPSTSDDTIGEVTLMIRRIRVALVIIATLGEMAIVVGARFFSPGLERACACALGCKP
jgi:hypothetical protein